MSFWDYVRNKTKNFINTSPRLNFVDRANDFIQSGRRISLPTIQSGNFKQNPSSAIGATAYNWVAKPVIDSALNLSLRPGLDIGNKIVNRNAGYNNMGAVSRLGMQVFNPNLRNNGQLAKNIGEVGSDVLNIYTPTRFLGVAQGAYKSRQPLLNIMKKEALKQGTLGGIHGSLYGLSQDFKNEDEQARNAITMGAMGAGIGGALGGVTPVVPRLVGGAQRGIKKLINPPQPTATLRNAGKIMGKVSLLKDADRKALENQAIATETGILPKGEISFATLRAKAEKVAKNKGLDISGTPFELSQRINNYLQKYDELIASGTKGGNKIFMDKGSRYMGAMAGFEFEKDENGKTRVKFNPQKAAIGLGAGMVAGRIVRGKNVVPFNEAGFNKYNELAQGLEIAKTGEYGKKLIKDTEGMVTGAINAGRAFPDWVPAHLRDGKIVEKVVNAFDKEGNFVRPNGKAGELFDLIHGKGTAKFDDISFLNTENKPGKIRTLKTPQLDENGATRPSVSGVTNIKTKTGEVVSGDIQDVIQRAINKGKDKGKLALNNQSPERNFEDIFGADAPIVKAQLSGEAAKNETARVQWLDNEINELKQIFKNLGIKFKSKEDQLVQRFAEKNISLADLQKELPKTWQNVVKASKLTRTKYDNYLTQINDALTRNGYTPIPKRKDYITHLNELNVATNIFGGLTNIPQDKLPAVMEGIHLNTKPGRNWFKFGQKREGGAFVESAINALDAYIPSASKQIFHTDTIQKARTFERTLQGTLEKQPNTKALSSFNSYIGEYVNQLAGKGAITDRSVEETIGRQVPAALDWIRKRTSANMIGGNISSALTNFIPLTQSFATTAKIPATRGLAESFAAPFSKVINKIDGVQSDFLTRRFSGQTQLAENALSKGVKGAQWLFTAIDKMTASSIVRGKYYEGLSKGLSKQQAMKVADEFAARVITDRSYGQMPTLYGSKTLGLITQFQAEVNNQLSFLIKDVPKMTGSKTKTAAVLAQVALYGYAYNSLVEQLTGRRPALDPIDLTLDTIHDFQTENEKKYSNLVKKIAGTLPYASTVVEGGRIPIGSSIPNPVAIINGESTVSKELSKPLYNIIPPTAGGQIRKSLQGIKAYAQGASTNDSGKVRFPIEKNIANLARTALFGQYSVPEAREYFDKGRTALSEKQSELYKAGAKTYDSIMSERDRNKELNKLKEGKKSNKAQDLGNGLYQVGEKFYSKDLDREFDTREEAQLAITKYQFDKSGKRFLIDQKTRTVFTKDSRGKVKDQSIEEYYEPIIKSEFSRLVDEYKRNDDINSYLQLNDSYTQYLQQRLETLDPDADRAEIIKLQNTIADNKYYGNKYASQGGFKKAKKPKKLKAPKAPSVSVARTKSPKIKTIKAKKPAKIKIKSL